MTAGEAAADRAAARAAFLRGAGLDPDAARPLAADASPRRYWRLAGGAILMDADPALGLETGRFAALAAWLRGLGLSAPEVRAADHAAGLLLLEDLGEATYARALADPATERAAYGAAVDALLRVQAERPPARVEGAGGVAEPVAYDAAILAREARLAVEVWAPAAGAPLGPDALAEFDALVAAATARAAADRRALALLDVHAENLIWLPARRGAARAGLLDFQDARIGAPAYDVASLLADARRDVGPALAAGMLARYAAAQGPGFDRAAFEADRAALSAQRALKVLGLFARFARRDGRTHYLAHLPRVWRGLRADLAHPALAGLRGFVERRLPAPDAAALARAAAA